MTVMDCLFCAIVAGEVPSRQVYADEHAVAFLDIAPFHRGHTLVIPRRHGSAFLTAPSALAEITPAVDATAALLRQRLAPAGMNLISSAGAAASAAGGAASEGDGRTSVGAGGGSGCDSPMLTSPMR